MRIGTTIRVYAGAAMLAALATATIAHGQILDHPIITEVYTDPPSLLPDLTDGPVGRDPTNLHQSFIEIYLPPCADLALGLNCDALNLTFYEVEGDGSSFGVELVNYRFDLPTFDLNPSNGLTGIGRPDSGVVVLGWVDYVNDPPDRLAGTPTTRVGLVNGGITTAPTDYLFIAINGHHFLGTANFPILADENLIDLPDEARSGVIHNGSSAYLLVNRDSAGYVELCDDEHEIDCVAGVDPALRTGAVLRVESLFDGFAGNDDRKFDVLEQPLPQCNDIPENCFDLQTVLPQGSPFSLLIPQVPERDTTRITPTVGNGYARVYVDLLKTTENPLFGNDPVFDAINRYRLIRNEGPFFPTPGTAPMTSSPPELAVARASQQVFEVLAETTGRPGLFTANVGGSFGIDILPTGGPSSNPNVANFGAGIAATNVAGQTVAFAGIAITPTATAPHGATASSVVTIEATNSVLGNPAVINPMQPVTVTATVLRPTTARGDPTQTTVFLAVQTIAPDALVPNEFLDTDVGAFLAAKALQPGIGLFETVGNGLLLLNPATNLSGLFGIGNNKIKEFPGEGLECTKWLNPPGPPVGRRCFGGSNDGLSCDPSLDPAFECPGGECNALCVGGLNAGLSCNPSLGLAQLCVGGANDGQGCDPLLTPDQACPLGACVTQCPSGECLPLDLAGTVLTSAEFLSGALTYDESVAFDVSCFDPPSPRTVIQALNLNVPDTKTFGGIFTPSELLEFADARGVVGNPRSGLARASTTRTFELLLVDTNVNPFTGTLETGLTDDFGIVVEVAETEPGATVVPGEFVFLSFTGGLQGADIDTLMGEFGDVLLQLFFLDLDNLHDVMGIISIERVILIDGSGTGELDVLEAFSLNPVVTAGCVNDVDCADGLFCNGAEVCDPVQGCAPGSDPCGPLSACDEGADTCDLCVGDADCNDGLFCNGFETCDASFLCQPGTNPCVGQACLEANDICVAVPCDPPLVKTIGPRYLEVTPGVGPAEVALLVTGAEPAVACVTGWVRADGVLGLSAESRPPAGVGGWNTISVRGAELVSGRAYSVRTDCDPANPGNLLSEPTTVTLWPFADVDNFNGVSIIDVTRILDGFSAVFNGSQACGSDANCAAVFPNFTCDTSANRCVRIRRENVDITAPAGCLPDGVIDILDVTTALDAFRGRPDSCSITCP